jgi:ribulose-phosphate 3-epimerase
MIDIIPAILPKDFNDLNNNLAKFVDLTKNVQIDICDGLFVSSITWPMNQEDKESILSILEGTEKLPFSKNFDFEFDLMVINAHKQFDFFVLLGAKKLIFHIEAEDKILFKEFLQSIDPYIRDNIQIGLAINTTTEIEVLDSFINYIDFIQCMGIEKVGKQGQSFDERVIYNVVNLKNKYPEVKISIDGGVNDKTIQSLINAGADQFVVGSFLLESNNIEIDINYLRNM